MLRFHVGILLHVFQGHTALHEAAKHCNQDARDIMKLLLSNGADVNAKDEQVSD